VGRGLDNALQDGQQAATPSLQDVARNEAPPIGLPELSVRELPLYPQSSEEAITLQMVQTIDPLHLGSTYSATYSPPYDIPPTPADAEVTW
jgi:hypothetical protein